MDNIKKVGKILGATQKEARLNIRKKAENFIQPHRTVDNINMIHPYTTEFSAASGASARLTFKVTEFPTPCTVNPPLTHISTGSFFNGDSPGSITELYNTTSELDPPNPDFVLVNGGIQVPLDGCYNVFWTSGAWGVGYYDHKQITVTIMRDNYVIRSISQSATLVTAILGPLIYSYAPASPVYAVVECHAGDRIRVSMNQNNIGEPYPWLNGGLDGFFSNGRNDSSVTVTLVAVAEK